MKRAAIALLFFSILSGTALAEAPANAPRYARAMATELADMGIAARCSAESPVREQCTFAARSAPSGRPLVLHALYDDESDTVYFHVGNLLVLPPERTRTSLLLQRLMELNWELLVGKFEWSPKTGEVRLSAILNTDSNFDRRAFRSIVRALETLAARYSVELQALLDDEAKR